MIINFKVPECIKLTLLEIESSEFMGLLFCCVVDKITRNLLSIPYPTTTAAAEELKDEGFHR